ncbi:MAG TPA: divergent polysaccharide deacetylase family protein [Micropepsaceae bacterium]|nr:divergent polysaccharide deacetylase family protein [Micropepsaceae bacterium]
MTARQQKSHRHRRQTRKVWPLSVLAFVLAVAAASMLRVGPPVESRNAAWAEAGVPAPDVAALVDALNPPASTPGLRRTLGEGGETAFIALVIDDAGLSEAATRRIIALPAEVTLAFLPYGANSPALAREAAATGHDVILHMPMAPEGGGDPGPDALSPGLDAAENVARLTRALELFPMVIGVNNHMGSRMTRDANSMAPVLDAIGARGLIFLDSRTTPETVAGAMARARGLLALDRDVFLDNDMSAPAIGERLAALELMARQRSVAVAIGHPHEATLDALEEWVKGLSARGLRLVRLADAAAIRSLSIRPVALDR